MLATAVHVCSDDHASVASLYRYSYPVASMVAPHDRSISPGKVPFDALNVAGADTGVVIAVTLTTAEEPTVCITVRNSRL